MWYAIICRDQPQSGKLRNKLRDEHLKRLNALRAEGRLLLAGPMPATDNDEAGEGDILGSLIIAEFENREQAKHWASEDPYAKGDVYRTEEIFPFIQRLP